jgi:hypothetical protein
MSIGEMKAMTNQLKDFTTGVEILVNRLEKSDDKQKTMSDLIEQLEHLGEFCKQNVNLLKEGMTV